MKNNALFTTLALVFAVALSGRAQTAPTPTVESVAPVVVKTVPEAGAKDVAAGIVDRLTDA
jgi:hypothetical protein